MNRWRLLLAALLGAVMASGITFGVQAYGASSSTSSLTTIYACIKGGTFTHVRTTPPTCPSGTTPIQWNSYPASANGTPECTGILHEGIDLSGCDLEGATIDSNNVSSSDFQSANLTDAFLQTEGTDINFSNATMNEAYIGISGGTVSNFSNATMNNGSLDGNLDGSTLTDITLTNSSLSGEYDANFTDADLEGSGAGGSTFTDADFMDANLSSVVFSEAQLSGANFAGANLTDANLEYADLDGAMNMSSATLTSVDWQDTICPDGTNSNNDGGTCVNNLG